MAILEETNMWFILIVVFAYDASAVQFDHGACHSVGFQNCGFVWSKAGSGRTSRSVPCSSEPQSSLDVDFAFCISLEAPALHGKYSAVQVYDFTKIKCLNAKVTQKSSMFHENLFTVVVQQQQPVAKQPVFSCGYGVDGLPT